MITDYFGYL